MTQWDRTIEPTEGDLIHAIVEEHLADVHTALPARVQSYDAATQTADLVPLVRHPVFHGDGSVEHEDLPVLPCVPVLFPRTQDHFIAFALAPGDMVLVVFNELAIGHWRAGSGDITDPGDLQRHSLSHGVAIPGIFHRGKKLAHAPVFNDGARLRSGSDAPDGTRTTFYANGTVKMTRGATVVLQVDPDGTVHVGGAAASQFIALANLVDARLAALKTILTGWTVVPGDGGAALKTAMGAWSVDSVAATKAKAT